MNSLRAVTENQIRTFLNVSDDEFIKLRRPAPEHMHDPSLYSDMARIVAYLHEEKVRQKEDIQKILAVFCDYDTDGICSSGTLSGSLDVFGFRYMVGVPTMEEGYGINRSAVDRMIALAKKKGYKIDMIITADNGINAHDGIAYAAEQGITVIVTDHHPTGSTLPQGAKVCIDPWKKNDTYPFKYNSGATVAWKVMLEYAKTYETDKLPLIERLIVLAGISNVADVMPVTDENRYMVVAAVRMLDELRHEFSYKKMADTPYVAYNTVFWGLHDLVYLLQESKDVKRLQANKKPKPLPDNEELISWYIGPMLNAPRRVHGTCLEAMSALMVSDHKTRQDIIKNLIELNGMKTNFRDTVLKEIPVSDESPVICVNTRHGISGLIAGKLAEKRDMPSIVFAKRDDSSDIVVYDDVPTEGTLTASARSSDICPLDEVIAEVNRQYPGMIRGGGHATAAGITIDAKDYLTLKSILPDICRRIIDQNQGCAVTVAENKISISCMGGNLSVNFVRIVEGIPTMQTEFLDPKLFASDVMDTFKFMESLRPYGEGFDADTKFELVIDIRSMLAMDWDPGFWKTFKFRIYGVECLTFNEEWANEVKEKVTKATVSDAMSPVTLEDNDTVIKASVKINLNAFRGKVTPQFLLSPL